MPERFNAAKLEEMLQNINKTDAPVFQFDTALKPKNTTPNTTIRLIPIYAVIALVLVISISLTGIFGLKNNESGDNTITVTVPSWYAPKKLNATTVTYKTDDAKASASNAKSTLTNKNVVANFSSETLVTKVIGANVLDITGSYTSKEHEACGGIYFDTELQKLVCLRHIIIEKMKLNDNAEIGIDEYFANKDFVTYTTLADKKSYFLNLKTGKYKELPISLYGKTMEAFASGDYRYILVSKPKSDGTDNVYLIDTKNLSYEIISSDYNAYMYLMLSSNGSYAAFTVRNDDGSMPSDYTDSKWVIYDIKAKNHTMLTGELISFVSGSNAAIFNTKDGYFAFDLETSQKITDEALLSGADKYYISTEMGDSDYTYSIVRKNILNGSEENLASNSVNAYTVSADNNYVYTYTIGDTFIKCINVKDLKSFKIPIADIFANQVREKAVNNRVIFSLSVNYKMDEILLCYYTIPNQTEKPSVSIPHNSTDTETDSQEMWWDFTKHKATETVNVMDTLHLTAWEPYFENSFNMGYGIDKSENLIELIELFKRYKYTKAPLTGNGVKFNKIFTLNMGCRKPNSNGYNLCDIDIAVNSKGEYCIYSYALDSYVYISKDVFNEIYDLCSKITELPPQKNEFP